MTETKPNAPEESSSKSSLPEDRAQSGTEIQGRRGGGESGGGPYSRPRREAAGASDGFMGHGGQSEMAYHGAGQLGDGKVDENPNAASEEQ